MCLAALRPPLGVSILLGVTVTVLVPGAGSAHAPSTCQRLPDNPPALRAAAGHLMRENAEADRQRLSRMRDLRMVRRFVRARLLVPVPAQTTTYRVDGVSPRLRVGRPWTRRLIEHLGQAFHRRFRARLKVTSVTRTVETQRALRRINGNAAPARGRLRSVHLTGAAVDISTQSLGGREVRWLRAVLARLTARRLLFAIEEVAQPHFHVMVFRRYVTYPRGRLSALFRVSC